MDFLKAGRCGKLDPTSGVTEELGGESLSDDR